LGNCIKYPHAPVDPVADHIPVQSIFFGNTELLRCDECATDRHAAVRLLFVPNWRCGRLINMPALRDALSYPTERDIIIFRRLALCFSEFHSDPFCSPSFLSVISAKISATSEMSPFVIIGSNPLNPFSNSLCSATVERSFLMCSMVLSTLLIPPPQSFPPL